MTAGLIAEKGTISRMGVFIIHGSIITVLVGSLIGLVFGFRGFVVLKVGEAKDRIATKSGESTRKDAWFYNKVQGFQGELLSGGSAQGLCKHHRGYRRRGRSA